MKRYLILILFLTGCSGISNDEIIAEVKKCKAAGMGYLLHRETFFMTVISVTCDYGRQ